MSSFSYNVRELRNLHGMSQTELADNCDLSQQYIAKLEAGTVNPGLEIAERIANALGYELRLCVK